MTNPCWNTAFSKNKCFHIIFPKERSMLFSLSHLLHCEWTELRDVVLIHSDVAKDKAIACTFPLEIWFYGFKLCCKWNYSTEFWRAELNQLEMTEKDLIIPNQNNNHHHCLHYPSSSAVLHSENIKFNMHEHKNIDRQQQH